MKTSKSFIFSWDMHGIESIVPVNRYEQIDKENTLRILKDEEVVRNPLTTIVQRLLLRARFNPQRYYEIYMIECEESLDEEFWNKQWRENPQETADLIRDRGHKLYSDRSMQNNRVII